MAFIKSFKDQSWLLPPSIEELIPQDHVCYLIDSFMNSLNYSHFEEKYDGSGHPAYHPRIILKLLVMGILDRIRSSRRLARNARENVVYMFLAEKLTPDFRTISDFRKNNPDLIKEVFKHTIFLAKQEGMIDLSHFSTDGTRIKANASQKHIFTKEQLDFLVNFIEKELETWAEQDVIEDNFFQEIRGSDQLPGKNRNRIQKIVRFYIEEFKEKGELFKKKMIENMKNANAELEENNLKNVCITDPESRFMRLKNGRIDLAYNFQITTDKNGIILANNVCDSSSDIYQLIPMVLQTEQNISEIPEKINWSFDNGYYEGGNIKFLIDKKINGFIPVKSTNLKNPYDKNYFTYNKQKDAYICPEKKLLYYSKEHYDKLKKKKIKKYKGVDCQKCYQQKLCTKTKDGIRIVKRYPYEEERGKFDKKMQTSEAKLMNKLRNQIVEPVFGDIKENKGMISILTRGLQNAKIEFNLVCAANNIRRIQTRKNGKCNLIMYEV